MDIHSFNKKMNKIAALADNGNTDGIVSSLERDLLLSYIRELYDIALDEKPAHAKSAHKETHPHEKVEEKMTIPTPSLEIEKPVGVPAPEYVPEVKVSAPVVTPVMVEIQKPLVKYVSESVLKTESTDVSAILAEIFSEEKVIDLSDKLSLTHIQDLTKSMGINEKIFTQQELFGNDQDAFNDTLVKLNGFTNFEEAKQYLTDHIISKYKWTSENKVKKAATFVRLIKRKYT